MAADIDGQAEGPPIPASADTLLRFQPGRKAGAPEDPDAPVYLLAGPSDKIQRAYRSALAARGLRYPQEDEINAEIRAWLDDMRAAHALNAEHGITPEQFDALMSDVERFQDVQFDLQQEAKRKLREALERATKAHAAAAEGASAPEAEPERPERRPRDQQLALDRYARVRRIARKDCPGVRDLEDQRRQFEEEWPRVMARVVLRGGERLGFTVTVVGTEADDATMARIDDETQGAMALFWQGQSALTAAQKKTSVSPPPSDETPKATRPITDARRSRGSRGTRSATTMNGTTPMTSTPAG